MSISRYFMSIYGWASFGQQDLSGAYATADQYVWGSYSDGYQNVYSYYGDAYQLLGGYDTFGVQSLYGWESLGQQDLSGAYATADQYVWGSYSDGYQNVYSYYGDAYQLLGGYDTFGVQSLYGWESLGQQDLSGAYATADQYVWGSYSDGYQNVYSYYGDAYQLLGGYDTFGVQSLYGWESLGQQDLSGAYATADQYVWGSYSDGYQNVYSYYGDAYQLLGGYDTFGVQSLYGWESLGQQDLSGAYATADQYVWGSYSDGYQNVYSYYGDAYQLLGGYDTFGVQSLYGWESLGQQDLSGAYATADQYVWGSYSDGYQNVYSYYGDAYQLLGGYDTFGVQSLYGWESLGQQDLSGAYATADQYVWGSYSDGYQNVYSYYGDAYQLLGGYDTFGVQSLYGWESLGQQDLSGAYATADQYVWGSYSDGYQNVYSYYGDAYQLLGGYDTFGVQSLYGWESLGQQDLSGAYATADQYVWGSYSDGYQNVYSYYGDAYQLLGGYDTFGVQSLYGWESLGQQDLSGAYATADQYVWGSYSDGYQNVYSYYGDAYQLLGGYDTFGVQSLYGWESLGQQDLSGAYATADQYVWGSYSDGYQNVYSYYGDAYQLLGGYDTFGSQFLKGNSAIGDQTLRGYKAKGVQNVLGNSGSVRQNIHATENTGIQTLSGENGKAHQYVTGQQATVEQTLRGKASDGSIELQGSGTTATQTISGSNSKASIEGSDAKVTQKYTAVNAVGQVTLNRGELTAKLGGYTNKATYNLTNVSTDIEDTGSRNQISLTQDGSDVKALLSGGEGNHVYKVSNANLALTLDGIQNVISYNLANVSTTIEESGSTNQVFVTQDGSDIKARLFGDKNYHAYKVTNADLKLSLDGTQNEVALTASKKVVTEIEDTGTANQVSIVQNGLGIKADLLGEQSDHDYEISDAQIELSLEGNQHEVGLVASGDVSGSTISVEGTGHDIVVDARDVSTTSMSFSLSGGGHSFNYQGRAGVDLNLLGAVDSDVSLQFTASGNADQSSTPGDFNAEIARPATIFSLSNSTKISSNGSTFYAGWGRGSEVDLGDGSDFVLSLEQGLTLKTGDGEDTIIGLESSKDSLFSAGSGKDTVYVGGQNNVFYGDHVPGEMGAKSGDSFVIEGGRLVRSLHDSSDQDLEEAIQITEIYTLGEGASNSDEVSKKPEKGAAYTFGFDATEKDRKYKNNAFDYNNLFKGAELEKKSKHAQNYFETGGNFDATSASLYTNALRSHTSSLNSEIADFSGDDKLFLDVEHYQDVVFARDGENLVVSIDRRWNGFAFDRSSADVKEEVRTVIDDGFRFNSAGEEAVAGTFWAYIKPEESGSYHLGAISDGVTKTTIFTLDDFQLATFYSKSTETKSWDQSLEETDFDHITVQLTKGESYFVKVDYQPNSKDLTGYAGLVWRKPTESKFETIPHGVISTAPSEERLSRTLVRDWFSQEKQPNIYFSSKEGGRKSYNHIDNISIRNLVLVASDEDGTYASTYDELNRSKQRAFDHLWSTGFGEIDDIPQGEHEADIQSSSLLAVAALEEQPVTPVLLKRPTFSVPVADFTSSDLAEEDDDQEESSDSEIAAAEESPVVRTRVRRAAGDGDDQAGGGPSSLADDNHQTAADTSQPQSAMTTRQLKLLPTKNKWKTKDGERVRNFKLDITLAEFDQLLGVQFRSQQTFNVGGRDVIYNFEIKAESKGVRVLVSPASAHADLDNFPDDSLYSLRHQAAPILVGMGSTIRLNNIDLEEISDLPAENDAEGSTVLQYRYDFPEDVYSLDVTKFSINGIPIDRNSNVDFKIGATTDRSSYIFYVQIPDSEQGTFFTSSEPDAIANSQMSLKATYSDRPLTGMSERLVGRTRPTIRMGGAGTTVDYDLDQLVPSPDRRVVDVDLGEREVTIGGRKYKGHLREDHDGDLPKTQANTTYHLIITENSNGNQLSSEDVARLNTSRFDFQYSYTYETRNTARSSDQLELKIEDSQSEWEALRSATSGFGNLVRRGFSNLSPFGYLGYGDKPVDLEAGRPANQKAVLPKRIKNALYAKTALSTFLKTVFFDGTYGFMDVNNFRLHRFHLGWPVPGATFVQAAIATAFATIGSGLLQGTVNSRISRHYNINIQALPGGNLTTGQKIILAIMKHAPRLTLRKAIVDLVRVGVLGEIAYSAMPRLPAGYQFLALTGGLTAAFGVRMYSDLLVTRMHIQHLSNNITPAQVAAVMSGSETQVQEVRVGLLDGVSDAVSQFVPEVVFDMAMGYVIWGPFEDFVKETWPSLSVPDRTKYLRYFADAILNSGISRRGPDVLFGNQVSTAFGDTSYWASRLAVKENVNRLVKHFEKEIARAERGEISHAEAMLSVARKSEEYLNPAFEPDDGSVNQQVVSTQFYQDRIERNERTIAQNARTQAISWIEDEVQASTSTDQGFQASTIPAWQDIPIHRRIVDQLSENEEIDTDKITEALQVDRLANSHPAFAAFFAKAAEYQSALLRTDLGAKTTPFDYLVETETLETEFKQILDYLAQDAGISGSPGTTGFQEMNNALSQIFRQRISTQSELDAFTGAALLKLARESGHSQLPITGEIIQAVNIIADFNTVTSSIVNRIEGLIRSRDLKTFHDMFQNWDERSLSEKKAFAGELFETIKPAFRFEQAPQIVFLSAAELQTRLTTSADRVPAAVSFFETNEIAINFEKLMSPSEIVGAIAHEMEHFRQRESMGRLLLNELAPGESEYNSATILFAEFDLAAPNSHQWASIPYHRRPSELQAHAFGARVAELVDQLPLIIATEYAANELAVGGDQNAVLRDLQHELGNYSLLEITEAVGGISEHLRLPIANEIAGIANDRLTGHLALTFPLNSQQAHDTVAHPVERLNEFLSASDNAQRNKVLRDISTDLAGNEYSLDDLLEAIEKRATYLSREQKGLILDAIGEGITDSGQVESQPSWRDRVRAKLSETGEFGDTEGSHLDSYDRIPVHKVVGSDDSVQYYDQRGIPISTADAASFFSRLGSELVAARSKVEANEGLAAQTAPAYMRQALLADLSEIITDIKGAVESNTSGLSWENLSDVSFSEQANRITMSFRDPAATTTQTLSVDLTAKLGNLRSGKLLNSLHSFLRRSSSSVAEFNGHVGRVIGAWSAAASFKGMLRAFAAGDGKQTSIAAVMTGLGIAQATGLDRILLNKVGSAVGNAILKDADKVFTAAGKQGIGELDALLLKGGRGLFEALGASANTASRASEILARFPVLAAVFGGLSIKSDYDRLQSDSTNDSPTWRQNLDIADLAIDTVDTALFVAAPFTGPAAPVVEAVAGVIALVRIVIDDVVEEIVEAESHASNDWERFAYGVEGFFKGFGKALYDVNRAVEEAFFDLGTGFRNLVLGRESQLELANYLVGLRATEAEQVIGFAPISINNARRYEVTLNPLKNGYNTVTGTIDLPPTLATRYKAVEEKAGKIRFGAATAGNVILDLRSPSEIRVSWDQPQSAPESWNQLDYSSIDSELASALNEVVANTYNTESTSRTVTFHRKPNRITDNVALLPGQEVSTVFLGMGTTFAPQYEAVFNRRSGGSWNFQSKNIIFERIASSALQTVYGNALDNRFFAPITDLLPVDYRYRLYGNGGDDVLHIASKGNYFFNGGSGNDVISYAGAEIRKFVNPIGDNEPAGHYVYDENAIWNVSLDNPNLSRTLPTVGIDWVRGTYGGEGMPVSNPLLTLRATEIEGVIASNRNSGVYRGNSGDNTFIGGSKDLAFVRTLGTDRYSLQTGTKVLITRSRGDRVVVADTGTDYVSIPYFFQNLHLRTDDNVTAIEVYKDDVGRTDTTLIAASNEVDFSLVIPKAQVDTSLKFISKDGVLFELGTTFDASSATPETPIQSIKPKLIFVDKWLEERPTDPVGGNVNSHLTIVYSGLPQDFGYSTFAVAPSSSQFQRTIKLTDVEVHELKIIPFDYTDLAATSDQYTSADQGALLEYRSQPLIRLQQSARGSVDSRILTSDGVLFGLERVESPGITGPDEFRIKDDVIVRQDMSKKVHMGNSVVLPSEIQDLLTSGSGALAASVLSNDLFKVDRSLSSRNTKWSYIGSASSEYVEGDQGDNHLVSTAGTDLLDGHNGLDTYAIGKGTGVNIIHDSGSDGTGSNVIFSQVAYHEISVASDGNNGAVLIGLMGSADIAATAKIAADDISNYSFVSSDGVRFSVTKGSQNTHSKTMLSFDYGVWKKHHRSARSGPSAMSLLNQAEFSVFGSDFAEVINSGLARVISPGAGNDRIQIKLGQQPNRFHTIRIGKGDGQNRILLQDSRSQPENGPTLEALSTADRSVQLVVFEDIAINEIEVTGITSLTVGSVTHNVTVEIDSRHIDRFIFSDKNGIKWRLTPYKFGILGADLSQPHVLARGADFNHFENSENSTDYLFSDSISVLGSDDSDYIIGKSDVGNTLSGEDGNDILEGGEVDDFIAGGSGSDHISGGGGDDLILGGEGGDYIDGGEGEDTVAYVGEVHGENRSVEGVHVNLESGLGRYGDASNDRIVNVENIRGSNYDDVLTGNTRDNYLSGLDGDDVLVSGGGKDVLSGGEGYNTYVITDHSSVVIFEGSAARADSSRTSILDLRLFNKGDLSVKRDGNSNLLIYGESVRVMVSSWGVVGSRFSIVFRDQTLDASGISTWIAAGYTGEAIIDGLAKSAADADGVINGGPNNDYLVGGDQSDTINGAAGHDQLYGRGGSDTLSGGTGNDILDGGDGRDTIDGGGGYDLVTYESSSTGILYLTAISHDEIRNVESVRLSAHNDSIYVWDGITYVEGGAGDDQLNVLSTNQSSTGVELHGGDGDDVLRGGRRNDNLYGDGGSDTVYGGLGDDRIYGEDDSAVDRFGGDGGNDWLVLDHVSQGVTVVLDNSKVNISEGVAFYEEGVDFASLSAQQILGKTPDRIQDIENVIGTSFNDLIIGDQNANTVFGGSGDDDLRGEGGDDIIDPGAGLDVVNGGSGLDTIDFTSSVGGVKVDLLLGLAETDIGLAQLVSIENAIGSIKNDVFLGNQASNQFQGNAGADYFGGSEGTDQFDGGLGEDTVDYSASGEAINVNLSLTSSSDYAKATTASKVDYLKSIEILFLTANEDTVVGDRYDNTFYSGLGSHTIDGGGGTDTLSYETASDINVEIDLTAARQNGFSRVALSSSKFDLIKNIENFNLSGSADRFKGDAGTNVVNAGADDDFITATLGSDTYDGGDDFDTVSFQDAAFSTGITVDLSQVNNENLSQVFGTNGAAVGLIRNIEAIIGTSGVDNISGSDKDELIEGSGGADILDGGGGKNTLSYRSSDKYWSTTRNAHVGVTLNLGSSEVLGGDAGSGSSKDQISNFANLIGSRWADELIGDNNDNMIMGLGGFADTNALGDRLDGGLGKDIVSFENSSYDGGIVTNLSAVDSGGWAKVFRTGSEHLGTGNYDTSPDLVKNFESYSLSQGDDKVTTSGTKETFFGFSGGDHFTLQSVGGDFIDGGDGRDTVSFTIDFSKNIQVNLNDGIIRYSKASDEDATLSDRIRNIENISAGSGDDQVLSDDQDNVISLGWGSDLLIGSLGGSDNLDGGQGLSDVLSYELVDTAIDYDQATSRVSKAIPNATDAIRNFEVLKGSRFGDTFKLSVGGVDVYGLGGDDIFEVSSDARVIDGGEGIDSVDFSNMTVGVNYDLGTTSKQLIVVGTEQYTNVQSNSSTEASILPPGSLDTTAAMQGTLTKGIRVEGTLTSNDREDYYGFNLDAGKTYRIEIGRPQAANSDEDLLVEHGAYISLRGVLVAGARTYINNNGTLVTKFRTQESGFHHFSIRAKELYSDTASISYSVVGRELLSGHAEVSVKSDSIERVVGTDQDDTIRVADTAYAEIFSGKGNDHLYSGATGGKLAGGAGVDVYHISRDNSKTYVYDGQETGSVDQILLEDSDYSNFWFSLKDDQDLVIEDLQTGGTTVLGNWNKSRDSQVESRNFEIVDESSSRRLVTADINSLINAMASFNVEDYSALSGSTSPALPSTVLVAVDAAWKA